MRHTNFDMDVLRSFVAGVELGTFSKAADRLGRSPSAVSAQLKKLEEQAGVAIFRKTGRSLALTEAGETMLAYARRLLDLNDQAALAMRGAPLQGWVRLGLQEDFGETLLPAVLGKFARAHPQVRIEARVGRNADLIERINLGQLDLALAWDTHPQLAHAEHIAELPMCWIASAQEDMSWPQGDGSLPIVAFETPCLFRDRATAALDRAGTPWRVTFTSPSLGGLWAATSAGLGLTVRTRLGLPASLRALAPGEFGLPLLPSLALTLYAAQAQADAPTHMLAELVKRCVLDAVADLPAPR